MAARERTLSRRLLFVVNVDTFFLSHRLPIAEAALRAGYEVHVAAALTAHRREEFDVRGIHVHRLPVARSSANPFSALRLLAALYSLFRRVRPDLVHLVTIKPVLLGGIAARLARVPAVVAAVSGLGYVFMAKGGWALLRRKLVEAAYRLSLGHPNASVIFQNQDDRAVIERAAGLQEGQSELIRGSGVDLREFQPTPLSTQAPIVLLAARLLGDKGVHEFVDAARRLHGHAGARFVLAGDVDPGNPSSLTREQLDALVKEGVVEWWGHRQDMPQVLSAATLVVLPSYREGLPKVLIEAAACGRPVVTTDVPGCRDAVVPGQTGLLVPAKDAVALRDAIRTLLDDPQARSQMGIAGRHLAETAFNVDHVVARHLEIYDRKLAWRGTPQACRENSAGSR
jgi:glycosyltransferase involved in cell wall biosynthesis